MGCWPVYNEYNNVINIRWKFKGIFSMNSVEVIYIMYVERYKDNDDAHLSY